ncbi:MAG: hypothetical protein MJ252_06750 [archaeon]|nr:hypothetical protein [archaeon]
MDLDYSNVLIKCLGKALGTNIKFICSGFLRFLGKNRKDITSQCLGQKSSDVQIRLSVYVCLCEEKIMFLDHELQRIYECISYANIPYEDGVNIRPILLDTKNKDWIYIPVDGNDPMINKDAEYLGIHMSNRNILLNNLLCYYTVFFEVNYYEIRSLSYDYTAGEPEETKVDDKKQIQLKFKEYSIKNYSFLLKGKQIHKLNANNAYSLLYNEEKIKEKPGKKDQKPIVHEEPKKYFGKGCEIYLDCSDEDSLNKFDNNLNSKEISYAAFDSAVFYLKNTLKSSKFWITKNEVFNKKMNLNEDNSLWEGWKIEARVINPKYLNVIFIYLRRKYIPPYYDTFQDFKVILLEEFSKENYEMNPEASRVANLCANSLKTPIHFKPSDFKPFLEAKMDALLVDEDTFAYYQSVFGIYGRKMYTFGINFVYNLVNYFKTTNVKEKMESLIPVLGSKKNKWKQIKQEDLKLKQWEFPDSRNYDFNKLIKRKIKKITKGKNYKQKKGDNLIDDEEITKVQGENLLEEEDTPMMMGQTKKDGTKKKLTRFDVIWSKKMSRFIGFVLNGGLTDYKMTYDEFLRNVLDACQNTNHTIDTLCYNTINLVETSSNKRDKMFMPKTIIPSLDTNSILDFNNEAMLSCISSNFLMKYLEISGAKFLATLLKVRLSDRLLKALLRNLSLGNLPNATIEKRNIIMLISPLREIFEDTRQSPSTLLLAGKNLVLLVQKETDKIHRIKVCEEGDVLQKMGMYLSEYSYDEQLVLCILDLFSYISTESTNTLEEILYNDKKTGLMDIFLQFLKRPTVPGVYYSQRIMIKVLTVILGLTKIIRAQVKERFNTDEYIYAYELLINLLIEEVREKILNPEEEDSSILEFKIFYLLIILTSKNSYAQNHIFENFRFLDIIENLSAKFMIQMKALTKMKDKATEGEKRIIGKKVYKFLELVYYLMINDDGRKEEVYLNCKNFKELKTYCHIQLYNILEEKDLKSDVMNMINKVFSRIS